MIRRQDEIKKEIDELLSKLECHLKYEDIEGSSVLLYHRDDYAVYSHMHKQNVFYLAISKGCPILMHEALIYCGSKEDIILFIKLRHEYFINNLFINDVRNIFGESYHKRYNEVLIEERNKLLFKMEEYEKRS